MSEYFYRSSYLRVSEINSRIDALQNPDYNRFVQISDLSNTTEPDGFSVRCIRIGIGDIPVLIVGGIHAREIAPPDALVEFAFQLINAYHNNQPLVSNRFVVLSHDECLGRDSMGRQINIDPVSDTQRNVSHRGSITYDRKRLLSAPDVRRIINRLKIFLVPLANPNGRAFVMHSNNLENKWWRTNRRNLGVTCSTGPSPAIGVDINRNFPPGIEAASYYNYNSLFTPYPRPSNVAQIQTRSFGGFHSTSFDPCDSTYNPAADPAIFRGYNRRELYQGTSSPERETGNIIDLVRREGIRFYLDIHSYAREIYYPWGINLNQTTNTANSFLNPTIDRNISSDFYADSGGRDLASLISTSTYGEYFPTTQNCNLLRRHILLGGQMSNAIFDSAGSDVHARNRMSYAVKQALNAYPATGCSDDFVFSTQLRRSGNNAEINPDIFPVYAFTMESGHESDGQFWPYRETPSTNRQFFKDQYLKVEREIHAAVSQLLKSASTWTAPTVP